MARTLNRLSAFKVEKAKEPGMYGDGGGLWGADAAGIASVRQGPTQVTGRLPPEIIQRIVRRTFPRFRLCYERALLKSPKLAEKITVRFVIDASGDVTSTNVQQSSGKDPELEECVGRAFASLKFPRPEGGGSVVVTYPIIFSPGS